MIYDRIRYEFPRKEQVRKKNNIPNLIVVVFIKGANAKQADDTSKE